MDLFRGNKWLQFPPFFSFIALVVVSLFNRGGTTTALAPLTWGVFLSIYISLCALSAFMIISHSTRYNLGIFLVAQGVLFALLGPSLGLRSLDWLGFLTLLIGLFISFYQVTHPIANGSTRGETGYEEKKESSFTDCIAPLPLPICVTDKMGAVVTVNRAFTDAVGIESETLKGRLIHELIAPDTDQTEFASGHWWITRIQQDFRHLLILTATQNGLPEELPPPTPPVQQTPAFIDAETSLYTELYMGMRLPAELERSQRYRRWLAAALVTLEFSPPKEMPLSEQNKRMLFIAFAARVKEALRSVDVAFLTHDDRIVILLPETALSGAKTFAGRVQLIPQEVFDEDIRELLRPKTRTGITFYNGTPTMSDADFVRALEAAHATAES